MATTFTPNYNLGKQIEDKNDTFLMSVITDNADKIDAALMTKEDNLPSTPDEPTKKYLNGNKEWALIEVSSGGIANNLYFTNINSDISGYKKIEYTVGETETEFTAIASSGTGEVAMEEFIYDFGLNTTTINSGIWTFTARTKVSNALAQAQLKFTLFVRNTSNIETTLFSYTTPVFNNTAYQTLRFEQHQPSFTVNATDRLGVKVSVLQSHATSQTITLMAGDGYASYFTAPLQMRHNQLRDLNGDSNYQHIAQTQKDKLTATTKTVIAEITDVIETSYWSATAPFTQNITLSVAGHTITDADYDLNIYRISNATEATDKLEIEAYSYIDKAVISANNTLTLTAYDYKPLTDINIKIEVVKKW